MISKNQIKFIRQLESKKFRRREGLFVAEGPKVVGDLMKHTRPQAIFATKEWARFNVQSSARPKDACYQRDARMFNVQSSMFNVQSSALDALTSLLNWMDRHHLTVLHSSTQIIIAPGYDYKIVKALVTNFHQPQSTLLLLVSAFVHGDWRKIYDYALTHDFRFLSYGDSSLLIP